MHKFNSSIDIAARMLVVSSFLVLMPCWAAFWSHDRGEEGQPRDVAKIVSGPASVSLPPDALCDPQSHDNSVGHDRVGPLTAVHVEGRESNQESVTPPVSLPDQAILGLQERLEKMGAGYMLLERYPDPQGGVASCYHFVCRIPIPANPLYQRTFETVDRDAVAAMQHVVREVELWQTNHSGKGPTR